MMTKEDRGLLREVSETILSTVDNIKPTYPELVIRALDDLDEMHKEVERLRLILREVQETGDITIAEFAVLDLEAAARDALEVSR